MHDSPVQLRAIKKPQITIVQQSIYDQNDNKQKKNFRTQKKYFKKSERFFLDFLKDKNKKCWTFFFYVGHQGHFQDGREYHGHRGFQGHVEKEEVKYHIDARMRVVSNRTSRRHPCQKCIDCWEQQYSKHRWGFQGDPEMYDSCPNCEDLRGYEFDQQGDLVCSSCAKKIDVDMSLQRFMLAVRKITTNFIS